MLFHIQNTVVSLDVIEKEFCCDLDKCKGCCCIEGDAGAPITPQEEAQLTSILPQLEPLMDKEAVQVLKQNGLTYSDPTGEKVIQVVNNKDCIFARTDHNEWCYCVIEKAYKENKIPYNKPISCHLYPIRLTEYPTFTAVEYHRWDICHTARQQGKKFHLPIYVFLKEPLIRRFGKQWYDELCLTAQEWKKQQL